MEDASKDRQNQHLSEGSMSSRDNLALAPYLDLLNHSSKASIKAGLNVSRNMSSKDNSVLRKCKKEIICRSDKDAYEIITHTTYQKYDQVFINYGAHGNLQLYMEYGFSEENNQNDFVPVVFEEIKEIFLLYHKSFENRLVKKAQEIVQQNKLHENLRIDSCGPSWSIAATFFILNNVCWCSDSSKQKIKDQWQNVFMKEDFANDPDVSVELAMLTTTKLKEIECSLNLMNKKLEGTSKSTYKVASNSFKAAHQLISFHQLVLHQAVHKTSILSTTSDNQAMNV